MQWVHIAMVAEHSLKAYRRANDRSKREPMTIHRTRGPEATYVITVLDEQRLGWTIRR